ncbi:pancreatic lipase-related protein 2-like, partial [Emydura macquarii macquarii]|uniref:pancreatic lipase-related protein 2-like n=1 Tax=Emydura macquarii macquarii TaxID=1129001 RepID=UPI00352A4A63
MFGIWICALFLLDTARGKEVCYKRLGCFTDNPPWGGTLQRPLKGLPNSPESINTTFLLYTRDNLKRFQEISAINPSTIKASNFRTHRKTRFIIHGYTIGEDYPRIIDICRVMLKAEDVNCIIVDWRDGSNALYTEAINNIRVVGAELIYFVDFLEKEYGYSPANVHFIGHSLGAHAAGEAGRRKPGIGRITGLDPAGPLFHNTPVMIRLDPSDAEFVDVIHSNAGRLLFDFGNGILQTCGHLDFYPNGGKAMPGCGELRSLPSSFDVNDIMKVFRSVGCSHKRSLRYYSESIIMPSGFIGYQCETYNAFKLGSCFPCPKEGCPVMGHYADKFLGRTEEENQTFFLNTGPLPPFARWRKKIFVKISGTQMMWGNIEIALIGTNGLKRKYTIANREVYMPGTTYTTYIDAEIRGNISKVEFLWEKHPLCVCKGTMGAENITVVSGKDRQV